MATRRVNHVVTLSEEDVALLNDGITALFFSPADRKREIEMFLDDHPQFAIEGEGSDDR